MLQHNVPSRKGATARWPIVRREPAVSYVAWATCGFIDVYGRMGRRGWRGWWRLLPPTDSSLWGTGEVQRRLAVVVVAVLGKRGHRRVCEPMEATRRRASMVVRLEDGRGVAFEGRGGGRWPCQRADKHSSAGSEMCDLEVGRGELRKPEDAMAPYDSSCCLRRPWPVCGLGNVV